MPHGTDICKVEQQDHCSIKHRVAIVITITKHCGGDEAWEETGTTPKPAQELCGVNQLVTGRCWNLPTAGSALAVGVLTSVGVGTGVQSSRTPFSPASGGGGLWKAPSSWVGCIRRCRDALYSDTTTQGKEWGQGQKQDGMSGVLGVSTSAASCLFLQHPTLCCRKESPS